MTQRCSVCYHPSRQVIEAALIGGQTQTTLADRFGLTQASISRHQSKHMDKPASALDDTIPRLELKGKSDEEAVDALCEWLEYLANVVFRDASPEQRLQMGREIRQVVELLLKYKGKIADRTVEVKLLNVIVPDGHNIESGSSVILESAGEIEAPGRR